MKVRDFERAIDALSADITIDEMKLRHSDVRQVNAHTDNQLIVWDETSLECPACLWKEIKVLTLNLNDYGQHQKGKKSL